MGSGLHNARKLLTEDQYAPGKILSPHLSPFVLDKDAYKPGGAEILQTTMVQEDSVETNGVSYSTFRLLELSVAAPYSTDASSMLFSICEHFCRRRTS